MLGGLEVTGKTWHLFRARWRDMLLFSILFALLIPLPYICFLAVGGIDLLLKTVHAAFGLLLIVDVIFGIGAAIILGLLYLGIYFYFCKRLGSALQKTVVYPKPSLAVLFSLMLVWILSSVAIFFGTILLVIPGLIFMGWYAFSMYECLFEGKRGLKALGGSKALVVGRWWRVAGNLVIPSSIFGLTTFIGSVALTILLHMILGDSVLFNVLGSGITALVSVFFPPLILLSSLVVYADLTSSSSAPLSR